MPVKKIGNKWEANKEVYDTEEAANKAYMAYLDSAMGVVSSGKSKKAGKKTKDKLDGKKD